MHPTRKRSGMPVMAIIGAGRGLGAETARRFGREGYDIALIARNQQRVTDLAQTCRARASPPAGSSPTCRTPTRSPTPSTPSARRWARSRCCSTARCRTRPSCARCWRPPPPTSSGRCSSRSTGRWPPSGRCCPACVPARRRQALDPVRQRRVGGRPQQRGGRHQHRLRRADRLRADAARGARRRGHPRRPAGHPRRDGRRRPGEGPRRDGRPPVGPAHRPERLPLPGGAGSD